MGALATPNMLVAAAAPFTGSIVLHTYGGEVTLFWVTFVSVIPVHCVLGLVLIQRTQAAQACRQTFTAE